MSKATDIPNWVLETVWERDGHCCVICGSPQAGPWCHIIRRSQGGLGVPENIFTGCDSCHDMFDEGAPEERDYAQSIVESHMKSIYDGWNNNLYVERKGNQ